MGPGQLKDELGADARENAGRVRRMVVTRTNTALYQVTGHKLLEDDIETRDAEVFGGVGFAARPSVDADAGDTEAIVAFVGGPGNPIIIAQRQEGARQIIAADLATDETQLHGAIGAGGVLIRIKANGTVEIRTAGGIAQPLMTKADGQALRVAIQGAATVANDGGAAFKAALLAAWTGPTGTLVLKGE